MVSTRTRLSSSMVALAILCPDSSPVGRAVRTSESSLWPLADGLVMTKIGRRTSPANSARPMAWLRRFCRDGAGWPAADPPGGGDPGGLPLAPSPFRG